jgi:class 3 adenylate cyclase
MPMFMDRHDMANTSQEDVAQAHVDDLALQERYGANYLTYWFDYDRQTAFCLVEAPDADTVNEVHSEAHGNVPNEVIPVDPSEVNFFLGRLTDPPATQQPINEPAFRTILFTDIVGSTEVHDQHGDEVALDLVRHHDGIVRAALAEHGGREVKHTGDGIMASFRDASAALRGAIAMQRAVAADPGRPRLAIRIGVNAGEPIEEGNQLFGLAVNVARRLCDETHPGTIMASEALRGLTMGKGFDFSPLGERSFKGVDTPLVVSLVAWADE